MTEQLLKHAIDYGVIGFWLSLIGVAAAAIEVYRFIAEFGHRLAVHHAISVDQDGQSDEFLLTNGSDRPANVYYIQLDWFKPSPFGTWCASGRKWLRSEFSSEDEFANLTIPARGQKSFVLSAGAAVGKQPQDNARLCLRLSVVGRATPVWLWV